MWNIGAPNPLSQIIRAHEGAVTGVSLHPTGDYVLSTSADQNWAFSDIRTGKLLTKVNINKIKCMHFLFFKLYYILIFTIGVKSNFKQHIDYRAIPS